MPQITASVTFLPLLDEPCACFACSCVLRCLNLVCAGTFDLLVYTDAASAVPSEWCVRVRRHSCGGRLSASLHREESEARLVSGAEAVRLRGFSTRVHRVETLVAYQADDAKTA